MSLRYPSVPGLEPDELEVLDEEQAEAAIPPEEMERRGLFDDGEPNAKYRQSLGAALVLLPGMLTREDKLTLARM